MPNTTQKIVLITSSDNFIAWVYEDGTIVGRSVIETAAMTLGPEVIIHEPLTTELAEPLVKE